MKPESRVGVLNQANRVIQSTHAFTRKQQQLNLHLNKTHLPPGGWSLYLQIGGSQEAWGGGNPNTIWAPSGPNKLQGCQPKTRGLNVFWSIQNVSGGILQWGWIRLKADFKIFPMSTHMPQTTSGVEKYCQINLLLPDCTNLKSELGVRSCASLLCNLDVQTDWLTH